MRWVKIKQIPHVIFQSISSSSSNFASFCSFMTHKSSVLSWLKRNILSTKIAHQSADFQTYYCLHWNSRNSTCHFRNQLSVFRQTLHHSSVTWDITFLYFFIWNFTCFGQKEPIKVQISRPSTGRMKLNQILYVNFQAASQFIFKFCITLTKLLWHFLAETYALDKKSPWKYNF